MNTSWSPPLLLLDYTHQKKKSRKNWSSPPKQKKKKTLQITKLWDSDLCKNINTHFNSPLELASNGEIIGIGGIFVGFDQLRVVPRRRKIEDPHIVFGWMPKLLRLANGRSDAQLQEGKATRTYHPTPQLYGRGEEDLQRNGLGSHFWGPFHE